MIYIIINVLHLRILVGPNVVMYCHNIILIRNTKVNIVVSSSTTKIRQISLHLDTNNCISIVASRKVYTCIDYGN